MATRKSIQFNPIDDSIAITAKHGTLHRSALLIYNQQMIQIRSFNSPFLNFHDCSWSSVNPNHIIVASDEGGCHLVDLGHLHNNPSRSFWRNDHSRTLSVDFNPCWEKFLSCSSDGSVNHWFIDRADPISAHYYPGAATCAIWNRHDPNLFASTCVDRNLRISDARSFVDVMSIADDVPLHSCDWKCNGNRYIATASNLRNHIKVWDIANPRIPVSVLDGGHMAGVCRVKFSPHRENQIASCSLDHNVVVWDCGADEADTRITPYDHHVGGVFGLDMSKHVEGRLASCGEHGGFFVWDHALPGA